MLKELTKQEEIKARQSRKVPTVKAIIDGKLVGALSGKTFDAISPIDGRTLAKLPDCDAKDVDRAVAGARKGLNVTRLK